MEQDTLNEIIEAEKEIRRFEEGEEALIREWLERRRGEVEEQLEREARDEAEIFETSRTRLLQEAEDEGEQIVAAARRRAELLAGLTEDFLVGIMCAHLPRILPDQISRGDQRP